MAELAYVTSQVQGVDELTSKIATTLFTPQGLFRDGLHSVYGHLSVRDWLQASRTCRNWYRGVCTAKCRELTIRHRKLNLHSPLRYHIIEIACYRPNDPTLGESGTIDYSSFELNDFIEILHQLPNLTAFSGILEGDKRPIPFLTAPIGLKRLNLTFHQAHKLNLLAAYQPALNIIGSIASLEELTLDCHPASDLSALKQLHLLRQLTLEHTVDSTVPNWAENLVSLVQALPQLTTLNLDFPYRQNGTFDFGVFAGFTLPQLRLFSLGRCRLDADNLTKLQSFLPNLSTIRGEGWNHQLHLHTCASFQQLTSLSFSIGTVPLMNSEVHESPGIEAISTCVHLVHLGFLEWVPQQATSWQMLFKELKHLNSLSFESIYNERNLLDLIPPEILSSRIQAFAVSNSYLELGNVKKLVALHRCHTLTLTDAFNQGGVSYEHLYQTLNDPLFLPNLAHLILINKRREYRQKSRYRFEWHQGDSKNQDKLFRQKTITIETTTTPTEVTTPAPRLVGIELNPGPDSITTTAGTSETDDPDRDESHQSDLSHYPSGTYSRRLNAQSFFKDGLILIFSFLPFKSLSALTQTCTSWLETVKQVKSRDIDLSHRELDLLCIPPRSCLAHHITRLCSAYDYRIYSLTDFVDWMKRLPGLQACRVRIEDNTWTNQPIYLPTTLTDINFTFVAITREGITSILTTIPDGSPRLARLAIRVEWHIELDLTPLERCVNLTYLSIHGPSMIKETCPISGSASSYYRSLLISIGAIPHLVELDLFSGDDIELAMILPLGFSFPNLRRFDLDLCELRPGMLEQLLQFVPNIEELNPCFFRCNDLHLCAKFKHLQSIALMTNPMDEDGSESSINSLPYLVNCSNLTHLQICLSLINDWVTLFEAVPTITSLTLEYQQPTFFTLFTSTIARRIKQLNFSFCSFQTIQLSLLQQFTSLTDLTIDPDSFNIKFDDLKNRFDDCSFIPFLTHLHIVERWRSNIAFEWDQVKRINTETYRLPTTNSTHLSEAHKAERLVGVELNPGPLNPIELQRTVPSSAVVSMTAQTLFKDALHLIYAYLTTHEWIAAFGTCHAWSTASESEPSRHLSCPIDPDGSIRFPLSNRHRYHFGRVHPHPPNRYLSPVTCDQVCRLLQELPFLIELECSLKYGSGDIATSSLVSWPKNLLHLTLDLGTVVLPTRFIRTLQTAHSLTKLCIDCTYVPESDWSVFQFLGEEDSFPRLLELKIFAGFDFIVEVRLVRLPSSLKRLSLTRSRCLAFNHILQLQPLTNLEYINLDQRDLGLDDLPRLHHLAPQLTELSPRLFLVDDFPHIHLFHQLQSITFNQKPVHLDHSDVNDSHILSILCAVSSLTQIKFCGWCFEKATSWNALASKLSNLTSLTFSSLCLQNSQFSSIRPFAHKLKKLCLERYAGVPNEVELGRFIELEEFIFISSRFSIPSIKADLSSPHLCPKLTRIVIQDTEGRAGTDGTIFEFNRTKGLNCDYRQPQDVKPPKYHALKRHYPREDFVPQLVGIEPNPGPNSNSPCLQLAQVVALKIANEFLVDGDVRHWAMTSHTMIQMLRSYELKNWISFAQLHQATGIGQPTKVMIYVADLLAQPNTRLLTQIRHISYGCPNPAFTDPGVTLTADDSIRLLRDAVHSSSCRKISSLEFIESHLTDDEGANMMSQIILANHQTLTHLDFHSIRIGPVGAQTLAEAIQGCPSMAHLNLSHNWIGDGGLSALGEVIKVHESMQVLDLCTTGLGVIGLMSLADGIAHSTSMTTLKLDENRINDGDIHHLTESIKMSRTMTHLSLSHNEFSDVCMKFLVDLIQVSRSMKRIDLDHNRLTDLGAIELASGLKHSPSMTECYLKRNRIGDRGASALAESIIHSPNLKLIKCSSNRLMTHVGQSALKFAQRIKAKGRVHLWSPEKISSLIKKNNSTRTTTSTNPVNSMNDFPFEFVAPDTTAASEPAAPTPSASSSPAIVTPPAAPLVGIELNPGPPPVGLGPNMGPTNPSDPRSVSPLSTLFKDGLQHVYSWLSNPDWRSAFTTCTHWYDGAARITGRSRSIHLRTSGILNQLTGLRRLNPLLRHVTTLTTSVELKWYKVTLGLHHLTGLRVLECQIDCRTINEVSEIFQLPPLLNDLSIDCSHSYEHERQVQTFIDVISMCSSLTALRLENLPVVDLSPLNHLTTLTHLVLTHEGWEDPARLLLLKSMPHFASLTLLDLWKGVLTVEDIRLIQLPTVRRLNLVDSRLSSRLLTELSTSIPNIESIHSSIPVSVSMASLQSFHSLTSLTFNRQPTGLDGVTITNDAILMGFSGHLTSLTQLNFWKWSFDTSESWNRLFQALPKLDRVEFHQASPSHIGSLSLSTIGPIRLRHVTIHQCSLTFDGVCQFLAKLRSCQSISIKRSVNVHADIDPSQTEEAISRILSSCEAIRTILNQFEFDEVEPSIHLKYHRANGQPSGRLYEWAKVNSPTSVVKDHVVSEPPRPSLVGIELNPGPFESNCDPTPGPTLYDPIQVQCVTPQSLFKCGLHSIYSYLNTTDWVSAFHSCRLWYAAAQTEPSRHLISPTRQTLVTTPTRPPSTLRHHFTSIQSVTSNVNDVYLGPYELLTALDWFPNITHIIACGLLNRSAVDHTPTDITYSRLTHCHIRMSHLTLIPVITHIIHHAPNLQLIHIEIFHTLNETDLLRLLAPIQTRTKLRELLLESELPINLNLLSHLPTTLTAINIRDGDRPCLEKLLSFQMPNLINLNLSACKLQMGDLKRLHRTAPNLTQIEPYAFALIDLTDLKLFHQVESITFRNPPPCELDQLPLDLATVLNSLLLCHSLTRLTFHFWYPASADLWMKYAQALPRLTTIQLKENTYDHPLIEWLLPMKDRLKQLHLFRCLKEDGRTLLLNGIDQFSELEELSFAKRLTSEQSSLIRDYFNNSSLLPKLTRLSIGGQSYVPNSFLYDKKLGLNVDKYRLPILPPTSPSTQLESNSKTAQVTGQLEHSTTSVTPPPSAPGLVGAELHPSSTSTTIPSAPAPLPPLRSVMPERLVGIETNPGPVRSDNDLASSNCSMTPHTLFKDGLLIIYSYLSTMDWSHAYRTCRHWYSVTLNERSRQISFPLRLVEGVLWLPPTRLVHHFTTFHHHPDLASPFKRTSHFLTLIHTLPHLTSIEANFDHQTIDDVSWSGMNITWPTALTALTLNCYQVTHMISLVQSLTTVPQLTQLVLSLPGYWERDFERFRTEVVLPDPVTTADSDSSSHNSKSLSSSRLSWSNLIGQLTHLNIFKGAKFMGMIPPHSKWPKLQSIDLSALKFGEGDLKQLHECSPNLRQLTPTSFCEEDFADVALFESVDTIHIFLARGPSFPQEALVTSTLLKCKHLTHLQLRRWMLLTPESWSELSESHLGTQLTHLEIWWSNGIYFQGFDRIILDDFHRFLHLRSLVIHMNVGVRPEELRAHFDSSSVLPRLQRFVLARCSRAQCFEWNIESGINVDVFRTQPIEETHMDQSADIGPAARLVGIELNPGPIEGGPTISSSPPHPLSSTSAVVDVISGAAIGRLYVDVLMSIFNFLSFNDLVYVALVHPNWFQVVCQFKWRGITYNHQEPDVEVVTSNQNQHLRTDLLYSRLNIHVHSLLLTDQPPLTAKELRLLSIHMSHLTALDIYVQYLLIDLSTSEVSFVLPIELSQLAIGFFHPSRVNSNGDSGSPQIGTYLRNCMTTLVKQVPTLLRLNLKPSTNGMNEWMDTDYLTELSKLSSLIDVRICLPSDESMQRSWFELLQSGPYAIQPMDGRPSVVQRMKLFGDYDDLAYHFKVAPSAVPAANESIMVHRLDSNTHPGMVEVVMNQSLKKYLTQLPHSLTELDLECFCDIEDPRSLLSNLSQLTSLHLGWLNNKVNFDYLSEALSTCTNLQVLNCDSCGITGAHLLRALKSMNRLTTLILDGGRRESLTFLSHITHLSQHLEVLVLDHCELHSWHELDHLESLHSLRELTISFCIPVHIPLPQLEPDGPDFRADLWPFLDMFKYDYYDFFDRSEIFSEVHYPARVRQTEAVEVVSVDDEQTLKTAAIVAIGSETTPPSSPLIGIEPNPGPSTKDSACRLVSEAHQAPGPTNATAATKTTRPNSPTPLNHALNSSTTTLVHPSTLFMDGLHLILSFLSNDDWWPTIRVSHHWYRAALTIRTPRQFNWPLRPHGSFPLGATSPFIRSITSISFPHSVFELSIHQFRRLIQVASGLRSLHQVTGRTIPHTHRSKVMDSAEDLNLPWSHALSSVRIDFNSNRCPHILHSVLQLTSLTSLHLFLPNQKPTDLSLQKPVTNELGTGSTYLTFSRLSGLLELRLSWTLDDLMANRLGNLWTKNGKNTLFPPSLTSLILSWEGTRNLSALPYVFEGMHQQLNYFSLDGFDEFKLSDLLAIHSCMPKLTELTPASFDSFEFNTTNLNTFKHLHTLGFYTIPWMWWGPMEQEMNEEEFIAVLAPLTNLTHIRFYHNILHGPSRGYWSRPWRRLANQLPQVRQLTFGPKFTIDAIRPLALILTFFADRLTHLGVSGAIDQFATLSYAAFDLVSSCTLLEEITFYHPYQRVAEVHPHVLHQFRVHFPRLTHLYILHEYELQTRLPKERLVGHDSRNRLYTFERSNSNEVERKPLDSTEVSLTHPPEVIPPASRLVGIELNPGPLTFLHHLTTYLTSKFRPTLVPLSTLEIPLDLPPPADAALGQLLFHDGLHLIYSYLSERDWSHAITCCRRWYGAAVKEPQRHMLCPFDWTGHVPIQPHYRFNRHIIGLKHGVRLPVFSFDQFIRVLTTLPHLTTLSSTITTRSGKDRLRLYFSSYLSNKSLTSVIYWPQHLQTIRLNLSNESYPTLTQTIPTIVSLTSCTLHYPPESDGIDFLRRICTHKQLTELTLITYSGSDLLAFGQIYDLPIQLTSLNINNRLSTSITRMRLPQLQKIVVRRHEPGALQVIHAAAPNLLTIPECVLELEDVRFLSLFTSLTTLRFAWPPIHPPSMDMETILVDGLTRCPALTEVKFSHHILTQPESWRRLATESTTINHIIFNEGAAHLNEAYLLPLVPFAPRLHHLSITCYNHGSSQEFGQFLHCLTAHFHQLRSFELSQCTRTDSTNFMAVKDYLASPHRLPELTDLFLSDSFDLHNPLQFEWTKGFDEMHMKDAVNYRAITQPDSVVVDQSTLVASAYSPTQPPLFDS